MLRFSCPACAVVLEAPMTRANDRIHCPKCHQAIQIPDASRGKPMIAQAFTDVPAAAEPGATAKARKPFGSLQKLVVCCGMVTLAYLALFPTWRGVDVVVPDGRDYSQPRDLHGLAMELAMQGRSQEEIRQALRREYDPSARFVTTKGSARRFIFRTWDQGEVQFGRLAVELIGVIAATAAAYALSFPAEKIFWLVCQDSKSVPPT